MIQQGRQFYEAGQFADAIAVWQEALARLGDDDNLLEQVSVLSNLSLAYQQLGQWADAANAIQTALDRLEQVPDNPNKSLILAQTLDVQGRLQFQQGQVEAALTTWQQAADWYTQLENQALLTRNQVNQAQALQSLGLYRQARDRLIATNQTLQTQPDSLLKAIGLRSLGNVLRVIGDLDASQQALEQSLAIAQALSNAQATSEALLSLGNTEQAQQNTETALALYQQAATTAPTTSAQVAAQLHQLTLLINQQQWAEAQSLLSSLWQQIETLPPDRIATYARIELAQTLLQPQEEDKSLAPLEYVQFTSSELAKLLVPAIQSAQNLDDLRATSYAIGTLGKLYEHTQQWAEANDLTQQALVLAQQIAASDIAYQWQWQLGRLLKAQNDRQSAIAAYEETVNTLQSLRYDLVAVNPDVQFSFRDQVEPVYRELVDLLLQPDGQAEPSQENLRQARNTIESLQLAELDNFFREACLDTVLQLDLVVDQDDPTAALIYSIILDDRVEVILKLPQQPSLRHYATVISESEVQTTLDTLRQALREPDQQQRANSLSQQVYGWLIQPAIEDLAQVEIKTLVFVLDGTLQSLPMAALYDGQQYLVEQYAVALTPGLQLFDPEPLQPETLEALAAGLSEQRDQFQPLQYVETELELLQLEVPSQVLLNQEFTAQAFQQQINVQPFPVVHLATHGQFSSDPDETFILAWDQPIKVNELDNLLRSRQQRQPEPIELLVLSACETAEGDRRAALGLAGVAIRAGARSTLASLWSVDDASTAQLISQFYQELVDRSQPRAEALRQAQLVLLNSDQYSLPLYWAPFVLIGNWL
ncbi:MAG: hypothetical protein Kow00121_21900 [Elainellaceae cyanobacterium]